MQAFRLVNINKAEDPIEVGAYLTRISDKKSHNKLADGMYFALTKDDAMSFARINTEYKYSHLLKCELVGIENSDIFDETENENFFVRHKKEKESTRDARARYCKEKQEKMRDMGWRKGYE